ncbi:MAG: HAD family phosphatase [bacterium]|nr:HAD family phosphatase [bacterium]
MLIWQKFKFGIFDVDGALFDNMPLCADAFFEIIKNFNFSESLEEMRKIYLETNGMNLNDQFKLFFDKNGVKYDDALITKLNKNFFSLRDNSLEWQNAPLFAGTESLIKTLRANGIKNFVSSGSNTDEVIFRLKKAGILEYFELVLGAEKTPKGLEHYAEFAQYCHENIKNFAAKAFLVSDGPNDMALAQKAGIFAIGITNTVSADKLKSAGANLVIKDFNELL